MFAPEALTALVRISPTAAMPRYPPSESKGVGSGATSGKAGPPWPQTLCLLVPPPGVTSVEGRFLVDVAASSRLFVDISPEGDPEGTSPSWFNDVDSSARGAIADTAPCAREGEGGIELEQNQLVARRFCAVAV